MNESLFEIIMGLMSLFGLFSLLVAIFSPVENYKREDIIVDIMVNILFPSYKTTWAIGGVNSPGRSSLKRRFCLWHKFNKTERP